MQRHVDVEGADQRKMRQQGFLHVGDGPLVNMQKVTFLLYPTVRRNVGFEVQS